MINVKTAQATTVPRLTSQTWYRAYRPRLVAQLHLESVRKQLEGMLASGRLPQALLFAGPRGTGKTSASRILGALLNDAKNDAAIDAAYFSSKNAAKTAAKSSEKAPSLLPLVEPDPDSDFASRVYTGQSFVVAELDAASNRGIDDVRSLRERAFMPPAEGRMAVFILDEVHMFTTEAFNALLKLLEEPPPHAVFILATTELHKVPDTIVSRCTLVRFRQATTDELVAAFTSILEKESIPFERNALVAIAQLSEGSFRDGVKLLEQVAGGGSVVQASVDAVLGGSLRAQCQKLVASVLGKDEHAVGECIAQLRSQRVDSKFFVQTLFNYLHQQLLQHLGLTEGKPVQSREIVEFLLRELLNAQLSQPTPIDYLPLELKLLELIGRSKQRAGGGQTVAHKPVEKPAKTSKPLKQVASDSPEEEQEDLAAAPVTSVQSVAVAEVAVQTPTAVSVVQVVSDTPETIQDAQSSQNDSGTLGLELLQRWDDFLRLVTERNSTLGALLRSGRPMQDSLQQAKIGVFYRFHQEQLQSKRFLSVIHQCSQELLGGAPVFQFVLQEAPEQADVVDHPANAPLAAAVADALLS